MSLSKFDNLWRLIAHHNLQIDGPIPDGVLCTICKRLMADPYVATCGCQFCGRCLKAFLSSDRRKCLGKGPECNEEWLEMDKTVLPDYRTRQSIVKVQVKCPFDPCTSSMELSKMDQHLLVCKMIPKKCPYEMIGCSDKIQLDNTTVEHLNASMLKHTQLLLEANYSLKSDVEKLKEIVEVNVKELNELKAEDRRNKRKIDDTTEERKRKETLLTEEVAAVKRCMLECLDKNTDSNFCNQGIRLSIERMRFDLKKEWEKRDTDRTALYDIESRVKANEEKIDTIKKDLYRSSSQLLAKTLKHDFLWILNHFSTRKGWYESDPFHKNHYKLSLGICVGSKHLYLYLNSVKGEKDAELEWPMSHTVTLTIVNQLSMTPHKSDIYKYDAVDNTKKDKDTRNPQVVTFGQTVTTDQNTFPSRSNAKFSFAPFSKPKKATFPASNLPDNRKHLQSDTFGNKESDHFQSLFQFNRPIGSSSESTNSSSSSSNPPDIPTTKSPFPLFGTNQSTLFPPLSSFDLPVTSGQARMSSFNTHVQPVFEATHSHSSSSGPNINHPQPDFTFGLPPEKSVFPTGQCFNTSTNNGDFGSQTHSNFGTGSIFGQNRQGTHTTPLSTVPAVAKGPSYNIWCLWISLDDLKNIPGLLLHDSLMVCCDLAL